MGIVSVTCTKVPTLSFEMAEIPHLRGNYRVAIYATTNDDWAKVARHVMSEGGRYAVLFKNLRREWKIEQRGTYKGVRDLIGHDNALEHAPPLKSVVEMGGFFVFEWYEVMSRKGFESGSKPVVDVSWYHAKGFTLTAGGIYLLSDEEWENAAEDVAPSLAHCSVHSLKKSTVDVDDPQFPPNRHGIHQMIGNVCEWTDEAPGRKSYRLRGGSWRVRDKEDMARLFHDEHDSDRSSNDIGFRVGTQAA